MEQVTIRQLAERVHVLMGEKLGVGGKTLSARARKAGRMLPRQVRRASETLSDALDKSSDPRLRMQLDAGEISAAYAKCIKYLERIDRAKVKSRARYSLAATLAFQLLFVAACAAAVLRWQGFI
jgi:hypothetical protein